MINFATTLKLKLADYTKLLGLSCPMHVFM